MSAALQSWNPAVQQHRLMKCSTKQRATISDLSAASVKLHFLCSYLTAKNMDRKQAVQSLPTASVAVMCVRKWSIRICPLQLAARWIQFTFYFYASFSCKSWTKCFMGKITIKQQKKVLRKKNIHAHNSDQQLEKAQMKPWAEPCHSVHSLQMCKTFQLRDASASLTLLYDRTYWPHDKRRALRLWELLRKRHELEMC